MILNVTFSPVGSKSHFFLLSRCKIKLVIWSQWSLTCSLNQLYFIFVHSNIPWMIVNVLWGKQIDHWFSLFLQRKWSITHHRWRVCPISNNSALDPNIIIHKSEFDPLYSSHSWALMNGQRWFIQIVCFLNGERLLKKWSILSNMTWKYNWCRRSCSLRLKNSSLFTLTSSEKPTIVICKDEIRFVAIFIQICSVGVNLMRSLSNGLD